jgi:hypothetical protein
MKQILSIGVLALALTSGLQAVPVDCNILATLQQYVAATDGCFVQDKLFTGFTYTGGGTVTAANIDVDVIFSVLPGQDIHGFTFTPAAGTPVWTTGFTLGYNIAIDPPSVQFLIVSAKTQGNFGNLANPASLTTTYGNGVVQNVSLGNESRVDTFGGVTSLSVSNASTIPSGGFLISVENTFTQTLIPEPASIILTGTTLLGLAAFLRRRQNSLR